jgi:hypothetical protein
MRLRFTVGSFRLHGGIVLRGIPVTGNDPN